MTGVVILDTNLLVLLIVGNTSKSLINSHKRLKDYSEDDFDVLSLLVSEFDEIVLIPHIVAETSNLLAQIQNPARSIIRRKFGEFISDCSELNIPSKLGVTRTEFDYLGITDAVILCLWSTPEQVLEPTLITVDRKLAIAANALGYGVIDFAREYLNRDAP